MALSEALMEEYNKQIDNTCEEISSLEDEIHDVVENLKSGDLNQASHILMDISAMIGEHIRTVAAIDNLRAEGGHFP